MRVRESWFLLRPQWRKENLQSVGSGDTFGFLSSAHPTAATPESREKTNATETEEPILSDQPVSGDRAASDTHRSHASLLNPLTQDDSVKAKRHLHIQLSQVHGAAINAHQLHRSMQAPLDPERQGRCKIWLMYD